jgi:hypothetical protein
MVPMVLACAPIVVAALGIGTARMGRSGGDTENEQKHKKHKSSHKIPPLPANLSCPGNSSLQAKEEESNENI